MFENEGYNPVAHGIVTAIRIYTNREDGHTPMAELLFAFGGSDTIRYDSVLERAKYIEGINAYTLIFDERADRCCKRFDELRDEAHQRYLSNKCRKNTNKGES